MPISTGVAKQVRYKKETTWGTAPVVVTGAQLLRRVTSNLDLAKQTYQSAEIRSDYQIADFRHGVRSVNGAINGELSPGTYKDFFAAALRADYATPATTGALITVTATVAAPQFVRSTGSWLTDGFKVGDVVRHSGWATTGVPNNARNFLITALTATDKTGVFLDGTAPGPKVAGDSVTIVLAGKKTMTPVTGHTDESFSIEHWFADLSQSELFTGCKVASIDLALPPTGISTCALNFMGKDMASDVVEYYTTPTAETTTGVLASVNGAIYVGNQKIALLTGLTLKVNGNMTADPVVGSNTYPDIFEGSVVVDGQMTALFTDGTLRDYFLNETEVGIYAVFTTGNGAADDFIAFNMPRVKAGGAGKDDGQKGIVQTIPFQALFNKNGGTGISSDKTTLSVQDSTVV